MKTRVHQAEVSSIDMRTATTTNSWTFRWREKKQPAIKLSTKNWTFIQIVRRQLNNICHLIYIAWLTLTSW